jgi:AmmeMemoRadiSam system protein B
MDEQETDIMDTRPAVLAGSWYPRQADACEKEIERYLARETDQAVPGDKWTAGIVPHAGWIYSGHLACRVINLLKGTSPPDLVVIFGMHLHSRSPNHIMANGAWETPFGVLPVAEDLAGHLMSRFDFKVETPRRCLEDNTVEVQLPFVKYLLNPACFLALGVPPVPQSIEIGQAVGQWAVDNKKHIRIIGSTDLTHYGPNYGFSPQGSGRKAMEWVRDTNDRYVIDAILAMDPERIIQEGRTRQNACCAGAVAAAVAAAGQMGADRAHEVAYASSCDRSPGDSFVGYVGVVMGSGD